MNKQEFMERLKKLLSKLPHEEYNEAVNYYEQYFADGGEVKESPEEVAKGILTDFAKSDKQPATAAKVWIIILSFFSIPFLLPLGIAAFVIAIAMYIVLFALFVSGVAVAFAGIVGAIVSLKFIVASFATTIFFFGFGCISLAIAFLLVYASWYLTQKFSKGLLYMLSKMLGRAVK